MKIEEKIVYNFELDDSEKEILQDAASILSAINIEVKKRKCFYLEYDYAFKQAVSTDEIDRMIHTLNNIKKGHSIY